MGEFFGLGNAQLRKPLFRNPFAEGVFYVFLVEEDVQPLERRVVGGHGAVVERQGVHAFVRHVALGQHLGQLFGAVVAVVEEDDHVTLFDKPYGGPCCIRNGNRFDKFIGHPFGIRSLHGLYGIGGFGADPFDNQVIGLFDTFPAFVAVHGVVAADDRSDFTRRFGHMGFQFAEVSGTALGVGVSAVHKGVHVGVRNAVVFRDVTEREQVFERTVYPAGRNQPHKVYILAIRFGIFEGCHDFGVFQNRTVFRGAVDFDQVLVDDSSGTDILVSHFGVPHLTVGQTDIFTAGEQLGIGVLRHQ